MAMLLGISKSFFLFVVFFSLSAHVASIDYVSILGDPLMASPYPRVMLEGWNFCNMAGDNCSGMFSLALCE
jgi:hypothetical protein